MTSNNGVEKMKHRKTTPIAKIQFYKEVSCQLLMELWET